MIEILDCKICVNGPKNDCPYRTKSRYGLVNGKAELVVCKEYKQRQFVFKEILKDNKYILDTPHGRYMVWKDWPNDCWVIQTPHEVFDTTYFEDAIDNVRLHLINNYGESESTEVRTPEDKK